jgi:hypothetical protein
MKNTKIAIIVIVLVLVIVFGGDIFLKKVEKTTTLNEAPVVESKITNELQRIIDEENFKKETILRARKVANDRKKEEEIDRNKKAMTIIEAEYEAIRQAELELVGGLKTSTSSLK